MLNKINTEESMPQGFNEVWVAIVNKQKFELTGEQVAVLKQADTSGQRGIIWFKDFAINIFNIECIYLDRRIPKNALMPGEVITPLLSEEQRAKNRQKIAEIKNKLLKK